MEEIYTENQPFFLFLNMIINPGSGETKLVQYEQLFDDVLTYFTAKACPFHRAVTDIFIDLISAGTTIYTRIAGTFINICNY